MEGGVADGLIFFKGLAKGKAFIPWPTTTRHAEPNSDRKRAMTEERAEYITDKVQPVESRIIRLKCADGSRITGSVNLNRFQGKELDRVSDIVTKNTEQFIVMYNVTVDNSDFDKPNKYKTLMINRDYIVWAAPDEDQ